MAHFLFKWLLVGGLAVSTLSASYHPIFVSVTEIEHNAKDKTLEISCKIFTDDFEQTLRKIYNRNVDLLNPVDKNAMNKLVSTYIQKHLQINVDDKRVPLQFLGYQQDEEGIISFFQANGIPAIKKLGITNNILYEYKKEQMGIIHITMHGKKQSTKLLNPEEQADFSF